MKRISQSVKIKRTAASCMAAVTLSMSVFSPVQAAPPQVLVDETMYVNLDYYGKETAVNVVKGLSTNGVTSYTDYGMYDKVVNMSDKTEPKQGEGTVSWQFPAENKRFYYQCTLPQNSVILPWSFDVSYKLNGADIDAAKLPGAAGLVEIHIKAMPEKGAKAYYRNNMMLTIAVPVDMEKCNSIEAPGSQLQSVGNNTVAMFAALPGEDGDYTVQIGTDSFESMGVMMMMVPGTMSALDDIKDLKEAKDTWRADGDNMHDSANQLLKTMESMKTDVEKVKGGLDSLENARAQVSQNRKTIENLSTKAIADLSSVTEQTLAVIPYLDTAQKAISDINENVNALSVTMSDTQDELDKLYDRLGYLRRSLESTSNQIGEGISLTDQRSSSVEVLNTTAEIEQLLAELEPDLAAERSGYEVSKQSLDELKGNLESASSFKYDRKSRKKAETGEEENGEETEGEAPGQTKKGPSGLPGSGGVNDEDFEVWSDEELNDSADEAEEALQSLFGTNYASSVDDTLLQLSGLLEKEAQMEQMAGVLMKRINEICASAASAGHSSAQTVSALRSVTDELINLMDDSRVLIDTIDGYVPSMLDSLGATKELMNRLAAAMGSTHDVLGLVNETMIAAGDSLDAGTKDSLNGLRTMLDKSLTMLDATTDVRLAGEGMKETLDGQLDKFENENQFLNIDPQAPKLSFTSDQNPSPRSIQIIVRTDEISLDDDANQLVDIEASAEPVNEGPLARMWRVFVEIYNAVVSIFKNR